MSSCSWGRAISGIALSAVAFFIVTATLSAGAPQAGPTPAAGIPPQALLPPEVVLSTDMAPTLGRADAPLTLIEFSDFECPFCGRYTRETRPEVMREYVDTGKVKYVFRNYPLQRIHPHALRAAEAAECARQQNVFWPMHERLFANQEALGDGDLVRYAVAAGANQSRFEQCFAGPAAGAKIAKDLADGAAAGITGTPTFFIGKTERGTQVRVLARIIGARPYASFKSALDGLLAATQ